LNDNKTGKMYMPPLPTDHGPVMLVEDLPGNAG
jgi:hypothetical protein